MKQAPPLAAVGLRRKVPQPAADLLFRQAQARRAVPPIVLRRRSEDASMQPEESPDEWCADQDWRRAGEGVCR